MSTTKKLSLDQALELFKGKKKDVGLFLKTCDVLTHYREHHGLTQRALAQKLKVNVRMIKTCEKLAHLPPEARTLIATHRESFSRSFLTLKVASRSFSDKRVLLSLLRRRIEEKPLRKRPHSSQDYVLRALEDQLRERFQTKIQVTGTEEAGEMRIAFLTSAERERLQELLLGRRD